MDYDDADEVQRCELVNLADLDTASPTVRATIAAYLNDLVSLGVAGFRIDAAKHMPAEDIAAIVAELPEGTRILQEVIRGQGEPITPEQYTGNGEVFEFGFARSVKIMVESGILGQKFGPDFATLPSGDAIVFVTNHDTERNGETLNYQDSDAYLLGNVFMLAQPYGVPVLYSGYAFESRDAGPQQDDAGAVDDASCSPEAARYTPGLWVCPAALARDPGHARVPLSGRRRPGHRRVVRWRRLRLRPRRLRLRGAERRRIRPRAHLHDVPRSRHLHRRDLGRRRDGGRDGSFTATVPGMAALAISVADFRP